MLDIMIDSNNDYHLIIKYFREYDYKFNGNNYMSLQKLLNIMNGFERFFQSVSRGIYTTYNIFLPLINQSKAYILFSYNNSGITITYSSHKYPSFEKYDNFEIDYYYLQKMIDKYENQGIKDDLELRILDIEPTIQDILGGYNL